MKEKVNKIIPGFLIILIMCSYVFYYKVIKSSESLDPSCPPIPTKALTIIQQVKNSSGLVKYRAASRVSEKMGNPSREEIFDTMVDVGRRYNIPPEILYAIGFAESELTQCDENGKVFISFDGGVGIMQVTPGHEPVAFDVAKVKDDYKYNIEVAAQILLDKWNQQYEIREKDGIKGHFLPKVGNQDPMILENWYFALWAYNGYCTENNPNKLPMYIEYLGGVKHKAYQERVIDLAKSELGIEITKVGREFLPADESVPELGTTIETPKPFHYSVLSDNNKEKNTINLACFTKKKNDKKIGL